MRPRPRWIGKGYTSPNPLSWQYHATKGWRKVAEFSRHALSPHRIERHQQEKRDPTPNKYGSHYTGKRGIAAERNRRRIEAGQIPRSQMPPVALGALVAEVWPDA